MTRTWMLGDLIVYPIHKTMEREWARSASC